MPINKLPPQAYTKDDVTRAYLWIQAQPEYVRNMATSKETLVALYLQARRNGNASLENLTPVSSKDFKSQLQTLASELEQFDEPEAISTTPTPAPITTYPVQEKKVSSSSFICDEKSEEILKTVKAQLNMESDQDIIRMLLVLGFEKIKEIFPNS